MHGHIHIQRRAETTAKITHQLGVFWLIGLAKRPIPIGNHKALIDCLDNARNPLELSGAQFAFIF